MPQERLERQDRLGVIGDEPIRLTDVEEGVGIVLGFVGGLELVRGVEEAAEVVVGPTSRVVFLGCADIIGKRTSKHRENDREGQKRPLQHRRMMPSAHL